MNLELVALRAMLSYSMLNYNVIINRLLHNS